MPSSGMCRLRGASSDHDDTVHHDMVHHDTVHDDTVHDDRRPDIPTWVHTGDQPVIPANP